MKRILFLAFCAMISLPVGARTLYVDAMQPNNDGNGLTEETAKKTIQAAVNAAKAGDTIVVFPGVYAPIKTKNKKLAIKAASGAEYTTIKKTGTAKANFAVVKLGKTWKKKTSYLDKSGKTRYVTESSGSETKGTSTSLTGFTIDGSKNGDEDWENYFGVSGGTLKSCIVQNVAGNRTVCRAKLTDCILRDNDYLLIDLSTLSRCQILFNTGYTWYGKSTSSEFANCLMAVNDTIPIKDCTLVNCTIADNDAFSMSSTKAWNTIFDGVASSQFKKKKKNTLTNCYTGPDPRFVSRTLYETNWIEVASDTAGAVERLESVYWLATNSITITNIWLDVVPLDPVVEETGNTIPFVVTNWVPCGVDPTELVRIPDPTEANRFGTGGKFLEDTTGKPIKTDLKISVGTQTVADMTNLFSYASGVTINEDTGMPNGVAPESDPTDEGGVKWTDNGKEHRFYLKVDEDAFGSENQYGRWVYTPTNLPEVVTNYPTVTNVVTETKAAYFLTEFDGDWNSIDWMTHTTNTISVLEAEGLDLGSTTNFVTTPQSEKIPHYYISEVVLGAGYHLLEDSPCINKGTKSKTAKKLFGSKDLDKKKRIKGKTVDIGCYEY